MELRKFIATTIREYLNENQISNNESELLYRGFTSKNGFLPKNKNAVLYFSPSLEYAKNYGDGSVMVTNKPNIIFDVRNKNDFNFLKVWLEKKIIEIIEEKQDDDGFLSNKIKSYIRDAKIYLKSDNPKDLIIAFANVSFAYFNGKIVVGVFEKIFMDENNINYMYMFESGNIKTSNDELSIAFRNIPKTYEIIYK